MAILDMGSETCGENLVNNYYYLNFGNVFIVFFYPTLLENVNMYGSSHIDIQQDFLIAVFLRIL